METEAIADSVSFTQQKKGGVDTSTFLCLFYSFMNSRYSYFILQSNSVLLILFKISNHVARLDYLGMI